MKKWGWMIGIMVWSLFRVEAQNQLKFIMDKEGKLFAIPVETNYEIRIPEVSYKSYTPVSEQNRQMLERYQDIYQKFSEDTANDIAFFSFPVGEREADRPMNMNTLSEAYRPFFNPYTPMLRSMNPMALDYNEYYFKVLSDNTLFGVNGRQETWPAAGGINTVHFSVSQQIGALTLTGGGFAGKYYTPYTPSPSFWAGFDAMAHYQVTEWLALRAWGSYAFYDDKVNDPALLMNPLLNQTNVGGAMEFKVGDHFGFGVGVNYQYNHFNNRFDRQYLIYPFGKEIRFGF